MCPRLRQSRKRINLWRALLRAGAMGDGQRAMSVSLDVVAIGEPMVELNQARGEGYNIE